MFILILIIKLKNTLLIPQTSRLHVNQILQTFIQKTLYIFQVLFLHTEM